MTSERRSLALVVVAWLATRLPLLGPGLGTDLDAWRLVHSARLLLETGTYVPSRPPGYPVAAALHVVAEIVGRGHVVAHLAVAALASLALGVAVLRLSRSSTVALAVVLHPLVIVHSTDAMDYVPAAALLVAAAAFARARPVLAGVLGGLATGCRPAVAPGIALARAWPTVVAWLATAVVVWSPAAAVLGGAALRAGTPVRIDLAIVAYQVAQQVTGVAGAVVLAAAALLGRRPFGEWANGAGRQLVVAAALAAPWIVFPLEPGYLVPALPFAVMALSGILRRRWFLALVVAAISNGVVSFAVVDRTAFREGGRLAIAPAAPGLLLRESAERRRMTTALRELADADLPARAVVLVDLPPAALAGLRPDRWRSERFERAVDAQGRIVALDPTADDVRGWVSEGRPVSWLAGRGVRYRVRRVEGYDPADLGAVPLAR